MKTLFPLLVLTTLVLSCGKSNDTGGSDSPSKPRQQRNEVRNGSVSVTSGFRITQTHIEFLEDKKAEKKMAGSNCFVATKKGYSFPFKLYENEMVFTQNGKQIEFTRTGGRAYSLNGTWEREEDIESENRIINIKLKVEISHSNSMTISAVCKVE